MDKLTRLKFRLLYELPFFHSFLSQCEVRLTDSKECNTAYIALKRNGTFHIVLNEQYLKSISENCDLGVLQHEILHFISEHLTRHQDAPYPKIMNIAKDIAINQLIESKYIADGWMTPELFSFEKDKTSEYYYLELLKIKDQLKNKDSQDEHDKFVCECPEKLSEAIVKEAIYKAYKQTYGNISSKLQKFLGELLSPTTIPWQTVLRRFVGMNISSELETTRTRANRRFGLKAPGIKKEYKPKIATFEDQSGSVDDESLLAFKAELAAISKSMNATIDCFAFDTEVEYLGAIDTPSKIKKERLLSGGTSFVKIFEEAEKKKAELIIIFTDGYGEMPAEFPKKPILWVLNHAQKLDLPGTILHLGSKI